MSFRIAHAGVISFADGSHPLECTVYEVSAAGAQLKVPSGAVLPQRFQLQDRPGARPRPATVVWRRTGALGVRFDEYFLGR